MGRRLKIYFDGGCRPNPGPVEVAVVIRGTAHVFTGLADGTNSDAEWCALIHALELSRDHNLGEVDFVGDALEVVRQANHALKTGEGRSRMRRGSWRWLVNCRRFAYAGCAARRTLPAWLWRPVIHADGSAISISSLFGRVGLP
ncbi:ribonuclease HI [Novosphingobium panipatense]|uniref:ribonuclease HI n=1 Tax=Novosphingobium panipatense TaxID=428991 RepID=UPI00361504FC